MRRDKLVPFSILYFASLIISISQYKITPILGSLADRMGITITQASWLMSVFTFAGIVMALPGGGLLAKLGPRKLLMVLMGCLFLGNLFGAFSLGSYQMLLIFRTLEGISFSMIIMTAIVLINQWFAADKKVGTAIGIYSTFVAVAPVIALNATLPMTNRLGFGSVWLMMAALAAVAFVLVFVFFREEARPEISRSGEAPGKGALVNAFGSGRTWLLGIAQAGMAFVLVGFNTLWPTLFTDFYGINATTANFYASICGLVGIPMCPLAGILIDKFHRHIPYMGAFCFILMGLTCLLTGRMTPATYILHPLGIGICTAVTSTGVSTLAPRVASRPAYVGFIVATVNLVYYMGIFAGPPAISTVVEGFGWSGAGLFTAGVCFLGAAAFLVFQLLHRKKEPVTAARVQTAS